MSLDRREKFEAAVRGFQYKDFEFAGQTLYDIVVTYGLSFKYKGMFFRYVQQVPAAADFRFITGIDPQYANLCLDSRNAILKFIEKRASAFRNDHNQPFNQFIYG
jgi:hypothetical protein